MIAWRVRTPYLRSSADMPGYFEPRVTLSCDVDCDATHFEDGDLLAAMTVDGDQSFIPQITESWDLRRRPSPPVDLPHHDYEPGGRRFESCWARQSA